jgi:Protein of unknown function (DUF2868)
MKQTWRIPDFLDLEYFFAGDKRLAEEQGEASFRERDRGLYLHTIGGEDGDSKPDREWLIYRWLQERRRGENEEQGGQALLPGRMWYELYGLFWSLFSFLAFAAGGGICYSYLSYSGEQPVNVSLFFLVFVAFQLLLLLMLPVGWFLRKIQGLDLRDSLLLSLVNKGLNRLLFKIRKSGFDKIGSQRKQQFATSFAAVQVRGKGYGSLFFWPLFLLFQLFGIAFNFGVLGALLVKVASSDLAFGWQSTIQLSSEFVARWVQMIALPWSWFMDGSYPSFAQIEGSRMVLKDGFYHLASADLVSWWPFLCLAICCYCLLPRIILFIFGSMARKRSLAAVSFSRAEHNQLQHRLLTPRLKTQVVQDVTKEQAEDFSEVIKANSVSEKEEVRERITNNAVNGSLLALVPDELVDDCNQEELTKCCEQRFGYTVQRIIPIPEQYENPEGSSTTLLLLQEAWQPPILELINFLKQLRENCEEQTHIIVALIGKPTVDTLFTPVTKQDLQIWQQKIALLADPHLQLAVLVEESCK